MKIRSLRIASLILVTFATLFACKKETLTPQLVVVNIRGTSYVGIQNYAKNHPQGYLSALLQAQNIRELLPVNNAVTATNLAAFETGRLPEVNGVIAHQFAIKSNDSFRIASGFRKYEVASFLEKAEEAGKSVLNLGSLLLHGATEDHNQLHAIAQGQVLSAPQIVTLDVPKEVKIAEGFTITVSDPSAETDNIPQWTVSGSLLKGDSLKLKGNQWTDLNFGQYQGLEIRCRVKLLVREGKTDQLLVRSAFVNRGYPIEVLEQMEKAVGGSVGWPSIGLFLNGQIDEVTVKEEIETELSYILKLFELNLSNDYDLITMDYPAMDRYGHLFSLSNSSIHTEEAYARLEQDLERIVKLSQQNGYQVLIQSGHGFSKTQTEINLHDALDSLTQVKPNQLLAVPGKVSAHLYFKSTFSDEEKQALISQISEWKDPQSGVGIVEAVWENEDLDKLGLSHAHSGDLYVILKPGYLFSAAGNNQGKIFKPSLFQGDHGYASKHAESRGVLIYPNLELPDSISRISDLAGFILNFIEVEE